MSVISRTFRHPLWNRYVTIDEQGIHESRGGRLFTSIEWDELESLNTSGARSSRERRITLRLSQAQRRDFLECASQIWMQRHPDRWQKNRERAMKALDRVIYIHFPLLMLGPLIIGYILLWLMKWPENLAPDLEKLHRMTWAAAVCIAFLWIWLGFKKRSFRRSTLMQSSGVLSGMPNPDHK